MKKTVKMLLCSALAVSMAASLTACGGSGSSDTGATVAPGEANADTSQTTFDIIGGMSALSKGYQDNTVLNAMAEEAGVTINWNTMSDSLAEQVNIRIAGQELPDAFSAVGFSNYDLTRYGEDGTFIDLTPYLTEEYMPNLAKILEEHPNIKSAITMSDGKIYGLPAAEQMERLCSKYLDVAAKYNKKVGIHAHNNQQLAFANTIEGLSLGASYLDATVSGMGRGAGNCYMELLLSFLRNPRYNKVAIMNFVEKHILKLKEEGVVWGYDIPYLLTGILNTHPSSAINFIKQKRTDYAMFYQELIDNAL